ncbi:hypothetical protein NP493_383g04077 [Ridgeia piscesae]|uniref:RIIa domain-containing protein n=1 Tax=Ridgeia piscesae TaxID=27915 RepID=A0AAD9L2B2_RIDPI|nr:hypothetical protein NP493_383g04077 [Ridgeia piscesae]
MSFPVTKLTVPAGVMHNVKLSQLVKLRVPDGFLGILESLYREVLRAQPDDVISFMALYLEDLLWERRGLEQAKGDASQNLFTSVEF